MIDIMHKTFETILVTTDPKSFPENQNQWPFIKLIKPLQ